MADPRESVIAVEGLHVSYDGRPVLKGVSLTVGAGELVAVVGHNGAGKSTLLRAVYGLVPIDQGSVSISGCIIDRPTPSACLARHVSFLPQGNRVFRTLTVRENLTAAAQSTLTRPLLRQRILRVSQQFPELTERWDVRAADLSGGEQQILALACSLLLDPQLLLLDEPSLGLAPDLANRVLARLRRLVEDERRSVLVVEQKIRSVLAVADRAYAIRSGTVSFVGSASDLMDEDSLRKAMW